MSNNDVRKKIEDGTLRAVLEEHRWSSEDIDFLISRFEKGELFARHENALKNKNEKLQRTLKGLLG